MSAHRILLLLLVSVLTTQFASRGLSAPRIIKINEQSAPDDSSGWVKAHPGPWGDLEWSAIYLEAPDAVVATVAKPDANPHWIFPNTTEAGVRALLTTAKLSSAIQERLFKRALIQGNLITLFPEIADLESLAPETRAAIYAELAKDPENEFHNEPVVITGPLDDWLRDAHLRPEIQAKFKQLCYHRGQSTLFSDIRLLIRYAQSDAELMQIYKTITRTRALIGRLQISPGSNPRQLIEYWTGGHLNGDIVPILTAGLQRTGGETLDITHLLPPIPRRNVYTFPSAELLVRGRMPDCHWTSLNFFNFYPQNYVLDMRLAANRLLENYTEVATPYKFGDLLCFLNTDGQAIHSCIYLADDVVFTKNGENSLKP